MQLIASQINENRKQGYTTKQGVIQANLINSLVEDNEKVSNLGELLTNFVSYGNNGAGFTAYSGILDKAIA